MIVLASFSGLTPVAIETDEPNPARIAEAFAREHWSGGERLRVQLSRPDLEGTFWATLKLDEAGEPHVDLVGGSGPWVWTASVAEVLGRLPTIADLVARLQWDDTAEDLAEDAFLEVGFQLLAGEVSAFLCGAATPHGDYRRWEWAAAYLLHVGAQCMRAHETHPLTLDELTARHGELAPDVDQLGPVIQGIRYERHESLPAWRQVDGEVCEAHGLPVRDSVDLETGEASRDCVRCFREGAGA